MKTVEIIICSSCLGKGYVTPEDLYRNHLLPIDYSDKKCMRCKGSGLIKKTVVTEFKPYNPNENTKDC